MIVRYAVEYCVKMFSCIFSGIFSLSAFWTQNIGKFDWLRGAGIGNFKASFWTLSPALMNASAIGLVTLYWSESRNPK